MIANAQPSSCDKPQCFLWRHSTVTSPIQHLMDTSYTHAKAVCFLLVLSAHSELARVGLRLRSLRKNSSQEWTATIATHTAYTKSVSYSYFSNLIPKHFQSSQKKICIPNATVLPP